LDPVAVGHALEDVDRTEPLADQKPGPHLQFHQMGFGYFKRLKERLCEHITIVQRFQPSNPPTFKPSNIQIQTFEHSNIQKIQTTRTVELDSLRWICPINPEPLAENSAAFR
jgi:hypothetical protein